MAKEDGSRRLGVSLFSGAGIGDLGFRAAGVDFLAMCEVEHDRAALAEFNFPEAKHFAKDIKEVGSEFCDFVEEKTRARGGELFLVACTAPCQGMSKNGQGTLLSNIRKGKRPELDPRNRLILPALQIIKRLSPEWVVFENVIEMRNTMIEDEDGKLRLILDIIHDALAPTYAGSAYDVEFADYGVAQRRQRLITVYTSNPAAKRRLLEGTEFVPPRTHAKAATASLRGWISVMEALRDFPPLDSIDEEHATSTIPFHRVPVLDPKKYEWIRHTAPGASAFDNQCINPKCGYTGNLVHGASRDHQGINRAHRDTPLYCEKCGELLPRPYTREKDGTLRIMSGYTSAYRRMEPDSPATTLTRNLSYPCSDKKLHPYQNRVLSLAEAMTLQTVSEFPYQWRLAPTAADERENDAPDSLIRLVIGESVPPRFLRLLGEHIQVLSHEEQLPDALLLRRTAVQEQLL